ncbi:uncharacterized protein LOC144873419 [Branchiostoma floridae x Branchiostoma japonicum]
MAGTEPGYMRAHNVNNYTGFFSSLLNAVKDLNIPEAAFCTTETVATASLILEGRKFTTSDASALAELFPYLKCLGKLHIIKSRMSASATRKIIDRLCELKHLTNLDLFSNIIDDEGVLKLTQTFIHLKNMKKLSLEANVITPTGGEIIACNIAKLQELETLIIGNEVASSLLTMTKEFLKMPNLRKPILSLLVTKPDDIPHIENDVREVVRLLKAKVYSVRPWKVKLFYDATDSDRDTSSSWNTVRLEMRKYTGGGGVLLESSYRELSIVLWVSLLE